MTTSAGLPKAPPQRPPMSRGKRELLISLVALPPLLLTGIYLGGRLSDRGPEVLDPAAGIASPLVTVAASPAPVATVTPPAPSPVATVTPPAPGPVATVKPPAVGPVATVRPPAPSPVVTVKPPAPSPVVTVKPPAPSVAPTLPPPAPRPSAPPPGRRPSVPPVVGPVAPTAPPPVPNVVLARGSVGADVRAWQAQMARRGWRIAVDGVFGPESERVARRFQRNKGLRVDGLVGARTWTAAWRLPVVR